MIISPHYPPSNLAAVHRSRLFAQHLPSFGWNPFILTVHEKYYEEKLDWNLFSLIPSEQRIEKVNAFRITKPRIIGDIGLRAFFQLRKKAVEIIRKQKIVFVYIPIPSFYAALIGPYLYKKTGVKYGIDYIDPWVHTFPGSEKIFSRHWFSTKLSKLLEPIALRYVSLITGVSESYYQPVLERNPYLKDKVVITSMPYGGEIQDHIMVNSLGLNRYLFNNSKKFILLYAGALLPNSHLPLKKIFQVIYENRENFSNIEFHFVGTGVKSDHLDRHIIRTLSEQFNLWNSIVFEHPERIPYLDVLAHLAASDAVFIVGSTESHYTPSKVYQGILSNKPIFAVLHTKSSAVQVIKDSNAGIILSFNGENDLETIYDQFLIKWNTFKSFTSSHNRMMNETELPTVYTTKSATEKLVSAINQICL